MEYKTTPLNDGTSDHAVICGSKCLGIFPSLKDANRFIKKLEAVDDVQDLLVDTDIQSAALILYLAVRDRKVEDVAFKEKQKAILLKLKEKVSAVREKKAICRQKTRAEMHQEARVARKAEAAEKERQRKAAAEYKPLVLDEK